MEYETIMEQNGTLPLLMQADHNVLLAESEVEMGMMARHFDDVCRRMLKLNADGILSHLWKSWTGLSVISV